MKIMNLKTSLLSLTAVGSMTATSLASQVIVDDVFAHSSSTSLETSGPETNGTLGNGWDTTIDVFVGVAYNLTASMSGAGEFKIDGSGITALLGTTHSRRVFTGIELHNLDQYELKIDKTTGSLVGVFGSVDIIIGTTNGTDDNVIMNTATGDGLLGIANVLNLFGTSDTVTLNFEGSDIIGTQDLYIEIATETLADVGSSEFTFEGITLTQVPEPSTTGLTMIAGGMLLLRRRRA